MMRLLSILMIIGSMLMLGCSSTPVNIKHYLLDANPQPLTSNSNKKSSERTPLLLERLVLASYLNQNSLAILDQNHTLTYANQHLWAEPLQNSITQLLVNDFAKYTDYDLILARDPMSTGIKNRLYLDIHHFVATMDGRVVLSGQYFLKTEDLSEFKKHAFFIEKNLVQDGYGHSVGVQRELLQELVSAMSLKVQETITR